MLFGTVCCAAEFAESDLSALLAGSTLFLARDRVGVKPLYYVTSESGIAFASEVKALFAGGFAKPVLELDELRDVLCRLRVPGSGAFAGVRDLEPGCWLKAQLFCSCRLMEYTVLCCRRAGLSQILGLYSSAACRYIRSHREAG